jgi:glutamyl-tRNA synthetase
MQTRETTRLAPSPTGALHLGNARTFLINWALARRQGWRIVLRIEDLDTPRTKAGADRQAIDDLGWLGLDWDEGPLYQAEDLSPYRAAMDDLEARGLIYWCGCSRRDMERAASAPHAGDGEMRYPGTCRDHPPAVAPTTHHALTRRLRVPDEPMSFIDGFAGEQTFHVQQTVGDFVVWTKQDTPAYQLAVVVDDVRQGVTHIVRGDDLLPSTARQLWLYRLLHPAGDAPLPQYIHLPLVLGPDGRRLAKRHGDTRLAWYREAGVPAQRVIALLARWCGIDDAGDAMIAATFAARFDPARLPRGPVTFTAEEHQWLLHMRTSAVT